LIGVFAGLLGLVVGSFLNVVIHRVPLRRSVVWPASRCSGCGEPIKPKDNIPLISYVLLRGRCRNCGTRIAARYPLVEALAGLRSCARAE
jgi:leader peptidase (prepilin peptidase)/N-methyltransferase